LKPSDARDYLPVLRSIGADPKGNLQKADELISQALVLDPNFANAHDEQARTFVIQTAFLSFNCTSGLEKPRDLAEWRPWALVGRKRGNIAKSAFRPKRKLRIVLLTAGGFAPHLIGRLVFSQPDVNRVPQ
jgi:hypothetical protein